MNQIEMQYDRLRAEAAFLKEMEGRQFGEEETNDAAAWFLAGWIAARSLVPDRKDEPHGRDFFDADDWARANAKVEGWNECRAEALK